MPFFRAEFFSTNMAYLTSKLCCDSQVSVTWWMPPNNNHPRLQFDRKQTADKNLSKIKASSWVSGAIHPASLKWKEYDVTNPPSLWINHRCVECGRFNRIVDTRKTSYYLKPQQFDGNACDLNHQDIVKHQNPDLKKSDQKLSDLLIFRILQIFTYTVTTCNL